MDVCSTPALYEQLAEECTELAHAALKVARIIRDENPTPVNLVDALNMVNEEFTDLMLVASVIELTIDDDALQKKIKRWNERMRR